MAMKHVLRNQAPGLFIRSGLRAGGQIVCYEDINGAWQLVATPCSTYYYNPPLPPSPPTVQRLDCVACNGTQSPDGSLADARCEECY